MTEAAISWNIAAALTLECGPQVRFVIRNGERVLQQVWFERPAGRLVWRDVPEVDEQTL